MMSFLILYILNDCVNVRMRVGKCGISALPVKVPWYANDGLFFINPMRCSSFNLLRYLGNGNAWMQIKK